MNHSIYYLEEKDMYDKIIIVKSIIQYIMIKYNHNIPEPIKIIILSNIETIDKINKITNTIKKKINKYYFNYFIQNEINTLLLYDSILTAKLTESISSTKRYKFVELIANYNIMY